MQGGCIFLSRWRSGLAWRTTAWLIWVCFPSMLAQRRLSSCECEDILRCMDTYSSVRTPLSETHLKFTFCSSSFFSRIPGHISPNPAYRVQCPVSQLHAAEPDHTWIQAQELLHTFLRLGRGIESHEKVLARVVVCLMFACTLGKHAKAPVGYAADCASRFQDYIAGCACNSLTIISFDLSDR